MLWNEDSFDIESVRFTKEAYEQKKWAFITDYVRLYVLKEYGGIYMDTDVEVLKNLDIFLEHGAFSGYENDVFIPTGIMGAKKDHIWISALLHYYDQKPFVNDDGTLNTQPNTSIITEITTSKFGFKREKGFQTLNEDLVIYPKEYFCPKSYYDGTIHLTQNTYTIHHFNGSWQTSRDRFKLKLHKLFISVFGKKAHDYIIKMVH